MKDHSWLTHLAGYKYTVGIASISSVLSIYSQNEWGIITSWGISDPKTETGFLPSSFANVFEKWLMTIMTPTSSQRYAGNANCMQPCFTVCKHPFHQRNMFQCQRDNTNSPKSHLYIPITLWYLGQAWASPTLAGLHCKIRVYAYVCMYVRPYTKNLNWTNGYANLHTS